MDNSGIIFELQWRKKGITNGREDVASIGIWADASLDWTRCKSYLCQNLGTGEDITFAYVDSEGDEIPIESECEFQEALKFARQRARRGRGIVLILDKQDVTDNCIASAPAEASLQGVAAKFTKLAVVRRHEKQKSTKPNSTRPVGKVFAPVEKARRIVAAVGSSQPSKNNKISSEELKDDVPPPWFKKYMQKMKNEIIAEVTSQITYELNETVVELKKTCHCSERTPRSLDVTCIKKKKKKMSDEESSDVNVVEQREHKLLRKIEKLQKREKKLEKKLDSKLEKLENRTKRMIEKKSHSKQRSDLPEKKTLGRKRTDVPVVTYLMDAVLLKGGPKSDDHIKLGECFTKVWQIMNAGTLPWTDKTELRLAWGTTGLEPQVTTVKCPILEPGERGQMCVTFKAPEFTGTFESYWHFYHMGVRFGHWISCAVIVDPKEGQESTYRKCDNGCAPDTFLEGFDNKSRNDHAVDLTVRSKSDEICDSAVLAKCEEVPSNRDKIKEIKRDVEYESDTESDNLSVISHTLSGTSDTGDEDNFVVIPMPASSSSEGNCPILNYPDANKFSSPKFPDTTTNTISTSSATAVSDAAVTTTVVTANDLVTGKIGTDAAKQQETPVEANMPDSYRNKERLNNLTHCFEATKSSKACFFMSEPEVESGESSQSDGTLPFGVKESHTLKNNRNMKNTVFAVDMQGQTVPIMLANRPKKHTSVIPLQSTGITELYPVPITVANKQKKHTFNPSAQPADNSKSHSLLFTIPNRPDIHIPPPFSQSAGNSEPHPIPVENCQEAHPDDANTTENCRSETTSCHSSTNGSSFVENSNDVIHILPETLVNGAVNVATSAFNTAKAVISNLRTIPSRTVNNTTWEANPTNAPSNPVLTVPQCMEFLREMGFHNSNLNLMLIKRYNNDIYKIVGELLARGPERSDSV